MGAALALCAAAAAPAQQAPQGGPAEAGDPVLALSEARANPESFRAAIGAAIERQPNLAVALAIADQAEAQVGQARAARLPSAELNLTNFRVISRDFSNDPLNVLERTRPSLRTDVQLSVNQTLFDFAAGANRLKAAKLRASAAIADAEGSAAQIAAETITAWYEVTGFRALAQFTRGFLEVERELLEGLDARIERGVAAPVDRARAQAAIARSTARLADFERRSAGAAARFQAFTGQAPPPGLQRAPAACALPADAESAAAIAARRAPAVRSADAVARAAARDAQAAESDRLPLITGGIDAGRFGLIETPFDYEVRARLGLRMRLFGGIDSRIAEAGARARAAQARADQARQDAVRDATVSFADASALADQLRAVEAQYLAARRTRDGVIERFRVNRGTLFDVLAAQEEMFQAAVSYVQALSDLDATRYIVLARTGSLLQCLRVEAPRQGQVQ
ncbi:TolC family protein [Sphingomonas sp.]|uniref:TolC family protein n=1 Tax=Sphingomonas sp. TaxID=28214 RepID=UPI0025FC5710|nr:TolC family protein [Sphingomonas sp.]